MSSVSVSIHMTRAEDAAGVRLVDHTSSADPFVNLELGEPDHLVRIFLTDRAVIDAIEAKLTEARVLLIACAQLEQVADEAAK